MSHFESEEPIATSQRFGAPFTMLGTMAFPCFGGGISDIRISGVFTSDAIEGSASCPWCLDEITLWVSYPPSGQGGVAFKAVFDESDVTAHSWCCPQKAVAE